MDVMLNSHIPRIDLARLEAIPNDVITKLEPGRLCHGALVIRRAEGCDKTDFSDCLLQPECGTCVGGSTLIFNKMSTWNLGCTKHQVTADDEERTHP